MITNYKIFLETKLLDLAKITGNNKNIEVILSRDFDDSELINKIHLIKYNKIIHINWNDNENHNIKKKLKSRSDFLTISDFNNTLKKIFIELFDNFKLLEPNIEQYDLFLTESNLHLITIIKYDQLFNKNSKIFIITILPQYPKNVDKIIKFNY